MNGNKEIRKENIGVRKNKSIFFLLKQKTAYDVESRDWSADVCSSDLYMRSVLFVMIQLEQSVPLIDRKSVV